MGEYRFAQSPGGGFAWRPSNLPFFLLGPIWKGFVHFK
jgi:hypothetical protein